MSYVFAVPGALDAAASNLAGAASAVELASARAVGPTTNLLVAASDEVSVAIAGLFGDYARQYQALSAQAWAFHDEFVRVLVAAEGAYVGMDAAGAAALGSLRNTVASVVDPPFQAIWGHPLIGFESTAGVGGELENPGAAMAAANSAAPSGQPSGAGGPVAPGDAATASAQNPVTGTVPVGQVPGAMVLSPDGRYLYVVNAYGTNGSVATVSVVNTATKAVVTVPLGLTWPDNILITPSGHEVYVSGNFLTGGTAMDAVVAINTATNAVSAPIIVGTSYSGTGDMVIAPDGNRIYIASYTGSGLAVANNIAVIDTVSHAVTGNVFLGGWGGHLLVSPTGESVYAGTAGGISVINTATNALSGSIAVPGYSAGEIVLSPDGKYVYAPLSPGSISIVSTGAGMVAGTISIPGSSYLGGLAISPDGNHLYIPSISSGGGSPHTAMLVFDTATGGIGNPILLAPLTESSITNPITVVSPDGRYVYTGLAPKGTMTIIDTVNVAVNNSVHIGTYGNVGGIVANNSAAYVTEPYSSSVLMINPALVGFDSLPPGTGFTGPTTPAVRPPMITLPGWLTGVLGTNRVPYLSLPYLQIPTSGPALLGSMPGFDLSGALDPITNAAGWAYQAGKAAWNTGQLILTDSKFGPLALVSAVGDAFNLGSNIADGNWGQAGLNIISIGTSLGRGLSPVGLIGSSLIAIGRRIL